MSIQKKNKLLLIISIIIFAFFNQSAAQTVDHWETVVYASDLWRYFVGKSAPPSDWFSLDFIDSSWAEGPGGIGYGDGDDATIIEHSISLFMRIEFSIVDTTVISKIIFTMDYDDAFVAYLNGAEFARSNIGSIGDHPTFDQTSSGYREATMYRGGTPEYFNLTRQQLSDNLIPGINVLAIQVHNQDVNSSDLSAIPFFMVGMKDTSSAYRAVPEWFTAPIIFTSSNLPIIIINTDGLQIVYEPKITARMGIIYNSDRTRNYLTDPNNEYNGLIGIEIRGQTSRGFDKKSYGLETRDSSGENLNVSLLGMPIENDWVLYGPYSDKTLMRNALSYTLSGELGVYAPRVKFCELILNDVYRGVYVFTEKIKRDKNRVNIIKMLPENSSEPEISGGFIFKEDKVNDGDNIISLARGLELIITEPKKDVIAVDQENWLIAHLNKFENALYSSNDYSRYIDVLSFVDNFLLVELTKNIDGFRLSTYFHKDRNGKIIAAPVWDYNLSFGNADYSNGWTAAGWYYQIIKSQSWNKNWWMKLIDYQFFRNLCKTRWTELRATVFSEAHILSLIDEWAELLSEAQYRNFAQYPILGTYIWPNPGFPESGSFGYPAPTSGGPSTWDEEIDRMKNFVRERLKWMDENMPGELTSVNDGTMSHEKASEKVFPYPNPFNSASKITYKVEKPGQVFIEIYNVLGKIIKSNTLFASSKGNYTFVWNGSLDNQHMAASSVYFYVIRTEGQIIKKGKIVKID